MLLDVLHQLFDAEQRVVDVIHLKRVKAAEVDAPGKAFKVVDAAQGLFEQTCVRCHPVDEIVPAFKLLFLQDGVKQTLFEQTFSDSRAAFVDELREGHFIAVFGDDGQLFEGVVPQVHVTAVVDGSRAGQLLDDMKIVFDDEVHQDGQRFGDERGALQVEVLDGRKQGLDLVDLLEKLVLVVDLRAVVVDAVVVMLANLQVAHHLALVVHPVEESHHHLGGLVDVEQVEDLVEPVTLVFGRTMRLIEPGLARRHVDGRIPHRVDVAVFIDEQRDDVVVFVIDRVVEVRARRDDLRDVTADLRRFAALPDDNDRVALFLYETVQVALEGDGRYTGKQRVLDGVLDDVLVLLGQLNVEQFGHLLGLADLKVVVVDLVDLEKGADLHENDRIVTVFGLEIALQVEIDLGK